MKDQFVPYELALQLKELGYNERDFGFYRLSLEEEKEPFIKTELIFFRKRYDNHNFRLELHPQGRIGSICTAPLWQQAFDWFRINHNLHAIIYQIRLQDESLVWDWDIVDDSIDEEEIYEDVYSETYEETRLTCLTKMIEIIKKK